VVGNDVVNAFVQGTRLHVVQRDGQGRRSVAQVPAEWAAYFRHGELPEDLQRQMVRLPCVVGATREGNWLKFLFRSREERHALFYEKRTRYGHENPLLARGVPHYEADVDPVRRFVVDSGTNIATPRRCYLDLETDSRLPFSRKEEMRILCWTVVDDTTGQIDTDLLAAEDDYAERDTLQYLWEVLRRYDQVCAWNGGSPDRDEGFDFPVLAARSAHTRADAGVDLREWLWLDHKAVFERHNKHSAESGEEKRSFRLQDIAMAVVGQGKNDLDAKHTYEAWKAGGESLGRLVAYNIQDTDLLRRIEEKTGYLDLTTAVAQVCGLFPDNLALLPTRQMDGFLLKLAREKAHHFPSRAYRDRETTQADTEQFEGAFVLHPRTVDAPERGVDGRAWRKAHGMTNGILRNVHVADFSGMYPNIIRTWNMSLETKRPIPVNGPIPEGHCRCPKTGTGFSTTEQGMLPMAVARLIQERKQWNDKKARLPPGTPEWHEADKRSMGLKVVTNGFYGALGNEFSRYYDVDVAEGVTQNGVWLIENTIHAAEQRGWAVVYGDTDSIMVVGTTREEFAEFVKGCNAELYPGLLKSVGCKENFITIAFEKSFDRLVFTRAKRYVGKYSHYKGTAAREDSEPEVRGLEYKRGDATKQAAELQYAAIKMLVGGEEDSLAYHNLVLDMRDRVLRGDLVLEDIVLSKALSKSLKEYVTKKKNDGSDALQPAHVRIAKLLEARGEDVSPGTRIEYVVVDEENEDPDKRHIPASDFQGECDRHYVWQTLVYPPTQRLLQAAFPDDNWERWARSRPPKPRKGRPGTQSGQRDMFEPNEELLETRVSNPPDSSQPKPKFTVRVDQRKLDNRGLEPVSEVLRKSAGDRPCVIELRVEDGRVVVLDTVWKVQDTPALREELRRFAS